jgi:hypothetical protein
MLAVGPIGEAQQVRKRKLVGRIFARRKIVACAERVL